MGEALDPQPVPQPSNEEIWRELRDLNSRLAALEATLRFANSPPAKALAANTLPAAPPPPPFRPMPSSSLDRAREPSTLETKIGAQVFNRIGVLAVLAGVAWFLKLAFDRAWIGPPVRVVIGLLVAIALMFWSEHFRHSGAVVFSNTLKALGSGIAYLSLWASVNLYQLLPNPAAFGAMVAVTIGNAALAWWQDSELLAALALAGGLATPALLTDGGNREIFLFSYLLSLDVGILALLALRPWPRLAVAAFAGTAVYVAAWSIHFYGPQREALTCCFLALFFAVFTFIPKVALRRRSPEKIDGLLALLPVAVGGCTFLEGYFLLNSSSHREQTWSVAAVLSAVYVGLTTSISKNISPEAGWGKALRIVHLSLAIAFCAVSGWLRFDGYGIALGWLAELAIVAVVTQVFSSSDLAKPLRANAAGLLLLSIAALLLLDFYDPQSPGTSAFFNRHFAVYLAGLAVLALIVIANRNPGSQGKPKSALEFQSPVFLAAVATVAFNVIALLAVSLQIEIYWRQHLHLSPPQGRVFHHPACVDFTYSAWFMFYGAGLMATGFLKRSAFFRWQGLILLTVSIAKVFLFDISHLNEGYRVLSFLGLGVLLLAISFAYQRNWLSLRPGSE
jgi:uncharacterized membrane protein